MDPREHVELAERALKVACLSRYDQNERFREVYGDKWVDFRLALDDYDRRQTMRRVEQAV